jgi:hypothetical protein
VLVFVRVKNNPGEVNPIILFISDYTGLGPLFHLLFYSLEHSIGSEPPQCIKRFLVLGNVSEERIVNSVENGVSRADFRG